MDDFKGVKNLFGERLKLAFIEAGLSQRSIALNELKVTPGTIQRWITGKAEPDFKTMERLSIILNKPIAWFFGGSEDLPTRAETQLSCIQILNSIQDINKAERALEAILRGESSRPGLVQKKS